MLATPIRSHFPPQNSVNSVPISRTGALRFPKVCKNELLYIYLNISCCAKSKLFTNSTILLRWTNLKTKVNYVQLQMRNKRVATSTSRIYNLRIYRTLVEYEYVWSEKIIVLCNCNSCPWIIQNFVLVRTLPLYRGRDHEAQSDWSGKQESNILYSRLVHDNSITITVLVRDHSISQLVVFSIKLQVLFVNLLSASNFTMLCTHRCWTRQNLLQAVFVLCPLPFFAPVSTFLQLGKAHTPDRVASSRRSTHRHFPVRVLHKIHYSYLLSPNVALSFVRVHTSQCLSLSTYLPALLLFLALAITIITLYEAARQFSLLICEQF